MKVYDIIHINESESKILTSPSATSKKKKPIEIYKKDSILKHEGNLIFSN